VSRGTVLRSGNEEGDYYFLGLSHLPPATREMSTKAMAIHEKAVWSVAMPITRKTRPSMRKMEEVFFRVISLIIHSGSTWNP